MVKNHKLNEGSKDYRVKPQTGQFFTREDPFTLWYDLVDKDGKVIIKDVSPNEDHAKKIAHSYYPGKIVEKAGEVDEETIRTDRDKQKVFSRLVVAILTNKHLWQVHMTEEHMRHLAVDAIRVGFIKHGPLSTAKSVSEESYKPNYETGYNIKPSDDLKRAPVTPRHVGYNITPNNDNNIIRDIAKDLQPAITEFLQSFAKWLPADAKNHWGRIAGLFGQSKYFDKAWHEIWPKIANAMKRPIKRTTPGIKEGENINEDGEAMKTNNIVAIYKLPASVTVWAKPTWTLSNKSTAAASENQDQAIKAAQVLLDDKDNGHPTNRAVAVVQFNVGEEVPENISNQEMNNFNIIKVLGDSELSESEIYVCQLDGLKNLAGLDKDSKDLHFRNGCNESLKNIKSTPNVHELKEFVKNITTIEEELVTISESDLNKAMIITTRALQRNPLTEASRVVLAVSKKVLESTDNAESLAEYIENNSGLDLHSFSKIFRENINAEYSEKAHNWVVKCMETMIQNGVRNKGEAFSSAWQQYQKKFKK